MKVAAKTLLFIGAAARLAAGDDCPHSLDAVYADMHDGDKKQVSISTSGKTSTITIQPSGNDQKWKTQAELDRSSCSASIDFNVKGKPGPPPVNLQATFWLATSPNAVKSLWGFTDPSGTLAKPDVPLNRWVPEEGSKPEEPAGCKHDLKAVYADMHDGDMKEITIAGTSMTIKPSGNNQTWVVESKFDRASCSASIDFNVTGKPGPPPVNLLASLYFIHRPSGKTHPRAELEFTDPSGTLPSGPLNHWTEISRESEPTVLFT